MSEVNFNDLVNRLEHPDPKNPDVQLEAAIRLSELGDVRAVESFIKAMRRGNQPAVRAHSAQAFWKLIDGRAIDPLIESLKDDPYYLVRSYAARALGKLKNVDKDRKSVQPLIYALQNDPFFGVRAEAAEALGTICKDYVSEVCEKAREALKKHDETTAKKKDERQWRVTREVERAIKEISKAVKDLREQGSKMSEMSPEEWDEYWKKGGRRKFLGSLRQLSHGVNMIGVQLGTGGGYR